MINELALFAGAGGGILGGILSGFRTVCAVEIDPFCREVLLRRQMDGFLPRFPIWDDVRTFDGRPWRGCVDVVSRGFPCQDISCAGKGAGIDGTKSGLWREMARIIGYVRPRFVFMENSPLLIRRGLARVLGDLTSMGYDARWCCLSAADVGAPHIRDRIWILGYTNEHWESTVSIDGEVARMRDDDWSHSTATILRLRKKTSSPNPYISRIREQSGWVSRARRKEAYESAIDGSKRTSSNPEGVRFGEERKSNRIVEETQGSPNGWPSEPDVVRVVYGLANRVDRVRALGNGQVPAVAALAWEVLKND